ncbi:MAG TPA: FtsX-like permease family protein [Cytophagaceae bacterium]|nr:FtsX-like permease family protein [Cytophagaceae bacterium]
MNLYLFISKRIRKGNKGSFSATVSYIAIITVALGMAVLIISFAVLDGFKKEIRNKMFSLGGHLQVTMADNKESYEENPFSINTDLYRHWRELPDIAHLQSYYHKAGLLQTKDEVMGVILKGIGKDYDKSKLESNLIEGSFFNQHDSLPSREIIVSKKIAGILKLKVRDSVLMYFVQNPPRFRRLVVKGIYETGLEEFDEQIIIGDIRLIRQLNNQGDTLVGGYEIFVKDFDKIDLAYKEIYDAMDFDMQVEKITDKYPQVFDWLQLLDRNVLLFLVIILLVASFNMVSSVFIMIMERTTMIGILKAMGATNAQVRAIFLYNGLIIILKGLIYGNLVGISLCYLQAVFHLFPLDPENYYMNSVPISLDWYTIFALNLLTFIVITIVLFLPVVVISYIRPVKSIRFN